MNPPASMGRMPIRYMDANPIRAPWLWAYFWGGMTNIPVLLWVIHHDVGPKMSFVWVGITKWVFFFFLLLELYYWFHGDHLSPLILIDVGSYTLHSQFYFATVLGFIQLQVLGERHYPLLPKYNESRYGLSLSVDGQDFTPEELVAMLLSHARDITVAYGAEKGNNNLLPKDIVLTVPSFYTQHERKALLDAAALADFNVLSLIDETTAAALHFGMDKILEEPQIIIFYNLGASSLEVSVVRFLSYPFKESKYAKERIVGGLEVLGKAWDTTMGGDALDHRIVEFLADEFNKKWGKGDVRQFPRPMAKLRIQANKVKHVLSANTEIPIFIEALHDDLALNTKMARGKLEELCGDLLERSVIPIQDALRRANVTLDQVHGIELIGGGMRVPKIQEYVQEFLGKSMELGLHINSDESMALGAAFHGANISTAFKVRHVGLSDINPFPVKIALSEIDPVETEGEKWFKEATMFKSGGKMGVKKTIAFSHDKDVHCQLDYEECETLPPGTQ